MNGDAYVILLPIGIQVKSMLELVQDAVSKGAEVVGGEVHGSLMRPAIVYPVNKSMR